MYFLLGKEIYTAKTYFTGGSYWLWIFFLDLALLLWTTSGTLCPPFCRRSSAIMGVYGSPTGLDVSKQSWTPQSRIPKKYLGSPNEMTPVLIGVLKALFWKGPVSPPKIEDIHRFQVHMAMNIMARWIRNLKRWNLSWWMMFFWVQEWPVESLSEK